MTIKAKISVAALILAAFVVGGFAFNAYKAEALKGVGFFFHKFGVNKEDWAAKKEEWLAQKGEWKAEWRGKMKKHGFGEDINHEVIILDNGIQITITSDNSDIVQKLHDLAEKFNK